MINSVNVPALQSRFAPLPMNLHIIFCVLATVLFLVIYLRNKKMSNIYWMLICDATLVLQWYGDKLTALGVAVCEIVLFVLLILELKKEKKADAENAEKTSDKKEDEESVDDLSDIAKVVKAERKAINKEKIDVIGEAFEAENND
ncbi:MAG: hypothetical protein IJ424_01985 [Oscillospiraceae bacterium]|nr:hypothetical protein [Oscillospiraceae bacterium]